MSEERLQKYLAALGFGSRRQIEQWIRDRKIKVNGKVAELGIRVTDKDNIVVSGKVVRPSKKTRAQEVLLLNKPLGYLCSRTREKDHKTVFELLPRIKGQRWISIGRLDLNTSGLLLFSTDGDLVNKLTHPSSQIEREYLVRVLGSLDDSQIKTLQDGILLDGKKAKFLKIEHHHSQTANHWYRVVLGEGKYREVRRLFESQDVKVNRLIRTRYGPITMNKKVKSGEHYVLSDQDKKKLYDAVKEK